MLHEGTRDRPRHRRGARSQRQRAGPRVHAVRKGAEVIGDTIGCSSHERACVGAGVFVVLGVLLFTAALFMIGERRMLFEDRFDGVYRVRPASGSWRPAPSCAWRAWMPARSPRSRSRRRPRRSSASRWRCATTCISWFAPTRSRRRRPKGWSAPSSSTSRRAPTQAPIVPDEGTIPGRDPFLMADLLRAGERHGHHGQRDGRALRGDIDEGGGAGGADRRGRARAARGHPPRHHRRSRRTAAASAPTRSGSFASIRDGEGTIGKLINDDTLYRRATRDRRARRRSVMANVQRGLERGATRHLRLPLEGRSGAGADGRHARHAVARRARRRPTSPTTWRR